MLTAWRVLGCTWALAGRAAVKPGLFACREYAEADAEWDEATAFLAAADGAGWDLLRACMARDWRARTSAEAALLHPFLKGAAVM